MLESHVRHMPSQKLSAASPRRQSHRPHPIHPTPAFAHLEKVNPASTPESSPPQSRHSPPAKSSRPPHPCAANPAAAAAPAVHHPQSTLESVRPSAMSRALSTYQPKGDVDFDFRPPALAIPNLK